MVIVREIFLGSSLLTSNSNFIRTFSTLH